MEAVEASLSGNEEACSLHGNPENIPLQHTQIQIDRKSVV